MTAPTKNRITDGPTPVARLSRDLRASAALLDRDEARFLVDAYYTMQNNRLRAEGQLRAIAQNTDTGPAAVLSWLGDQNETLERQIKGALEKYARAQPIGEWALGICGIGPVIAAGLIAHIDITRAPTVGHIWRYAGLDPTSKWEKGKKRPWNAALKTLCWHAGECFVRVSGNDADIYGKVWRQRKEQEISRNEAGEYAEQARAMLEKFRFGDDTGARKSYEAGKLPPGHIHARAKRYAVKLFLSHLWEEWRTLEGLPVVAPYPIQFQGHAHKIERPQG